MQTLKFKFHWSFVILALGLCMCGKALVFFCYTLVVILHEFGHFFVAKKLGYKLNLITLMPYGASLSGNENNLKNTHEILIALAGPLVNVLLLLLGLFVRNFIFNNGIINLFICANLSTIFFNILPIFPLDGGRILLAILSQNSSRQLAKKKVNIIGYIICFVFIAMFVLSYFYSLNYMLGINSLFLLICCMEDSTSTYFKDLNDLVMSENLLKLSPKKVYKIHEEKTLLESYKIIDKNYVCKIFIIDNNNNIRKEINNQDIKKLLFESKYNLTLKKAFCE